MFPGNVYHIRKPIADVDHHLFALQIREEAED
jgi:hypothetical protein